LTLYYIKQKNGGSNQKGKYWIVRTKDGTEYRFGYNQDSETLSSVRDYVRRWNLDRVTDTHGNQIYYNYNESPPNDMGTVYLKNITYNNDGKRIINFTYEDRPDILTVYEQGSKIKQKKRLKEIEIKSDGRLVKKYVFNYSVNLAKSKSLLDEITEYGGDGESQLPENRFEYDYDSGDFDETTINWGTPSGSWKVRAIDAFGTYDDTFDINGDGLPDLIDGCEDGHWNVYLNNGSGFDETPINWGTPSGSWKVRDTTTFGTYDDTFDINGDGLPDLIDGCEDGHWNVYLNDIIYPNNLIQINNSLGGTTNITYTPSTKFNNTNLGFSYWLVDSTITDNGMSGDHHTSTTINYDYAKGYYDYEDKEFRGFGYVKVTDPKDTTIEHYFHQSDALKGMEYKTWVNDSQGSPYAKTENTWASTESNGIYETFLTQADGYTHDGAIENPEVTSTQYDYDDYGNIIKISQSGDTDAANDERYIYNEYTYNTSSWILDRVNHTYLHDSDDSTKLSEAWYYYDNNANLDDPPTKGDLTKEILWLNTGNNPETTYTYDNYGNVLSVTDAEGQTTQYTYDTEVHTFPEEMTNAKGQTTTYSYDLGTGNLLSATDPNGFAIDYEYDTFGRIIKEILPYDNADFPTVSYEYNLDGTAPESVKVSARELSGEEETLDTITFVDGLGRVIQTKADAEDTSQQIVADIYYNEVGEVEKQYVPYLSPYTNSHTIPTPADTKFTSYEYDPIGRVIKVINPDTTQKTTRYDHWTVTRTDENDHQKAYHLDAYDRIVQVDEKNDGETYTTTYNYNARNELEKITDNENNIFEFEYDSLGRKTKLIDPDMGTWTYTYDKVGNLKTQTDNRDITITFDYDELNRIKKKDYPTDTDVTYSYDNDSYENGMIGTLTEVSDSSGIIHYYYDNRLRTIREEKTINAETFVTEWTYDALDRPKTQKYPDDETVIFTYNNQGELETLSNILTDIDYNELNKITQKIYGNTVRTDLSYDPEDNFRLRNIYTVGNSITLQNLSYTYDDIGNVESIADNTESKTQYFGYDALDRLTSAYETGGYSYTYGYNSIGNLINMDNGSRITGFSYGDGPAGPHALTKTLNVCFSIPLKDGWNLISIPLQPPNTDLNTVLAPIEGKYTKVFTYDQSSGWTYKAYVDGIWYGSLSEIVPERGYWLYTTNDAILTVCGYPVNNRTISLSSGWNLIGYPSNVNMRVNKSYFYDEKHINKIFGYKGGDGWFYWAYFDGSEFDTLNELKPEFGYWFYATQNTNITVPVYNISGDTGVSGFGVGVEGMGSVGTMSTDDVCMSVTTVSGRLYDDSLQFIQGGKANVTAYFNGAEVGSSHVDENGRYYVGIKRMPETDINITLNVTGDWEGSKNIIMSCGEEKGENIIVEKTWHNCSFQYRKPITIDNTQNPENLVDYQTLVILNSSNFGFSKAKSNGEDIRFVDGGEELNYWIEEWDKKV